MIANGIENIRILLAVSRTRTVTFSKRSRMVENSPPAKGSPAEIAAWTVRISQ